METNSVAQITCNVKLLYTFSGLVKVKTRREIFNPIYVCNRYIFQAQATHPATFFGPRSEKRISIFQNPVNCATEELLLF